MQPSFDANMWVEVMKSISKNKVYEFGPNAYLSSILARTPISCSTSQADGPSESASTVYSATPRAMEMTQEHIVGASMNPQHRKMLRSPISSLDFTSSEQLSSSPQEGTQSDIPPTDPLCD